MIKFENLKIRNQIVSDPTQAHRDKFERQETDHKILTNSTSYKTFFYSTTSILKIKLLTPISVSSFTTC